MTFLRITRLDGTVTTQIVGSCQISFAGIHSVEIRDIDGKTAEVTIAERESPKALKVAP